MPSHQQRGRRGTRRASSIAASSSTTRTTWFWSAVPAPARSTSPALGVHADLVILDELGDLPFSTSGGALLFHLLSKLYERTSVVITTNLGLPNGPPSSATPR
jgi:hypothetical protein